MKSIILIVILGFFAVPAIGLNELGELSFAKKNHPAVFATGNVLDYNVGGVVGYTYNGEAEQCFSGNMAESDSELYQEAVLDANNNLHKFLTKSDKSKSIHISGAQKIYEYSEGKMRRIVMFVAKNNVVISKNEEASSIVVANDAVKSFVPELGKEQENKVGGVKQHGGELKEEILSDVKQKSETVACGEKSEIKRASKMTQENKKVALANEQEEILDPLEQYLENIASNPTDCISMSKAAKIFSRRGEYRRAKSMYADIVKTVIADERMDKEFAAGLLMEAAKYTKESGDINCAVKYYRLIIRCDGMRRWGLHEQVDEANKNISQLLLKTF